MVSFNYFQLTYILNILDIFYDSLFFLFFIKFFPFFVFIYLYKITYIFNIYINLFLLNIFFFKIINFNILIISLKFIFCTSLLIFVRGGIPRYRYDFLTKIG